MHSFRDVIELWPSRDSMAADVGAEPTSVSKWWQRDSIPAWWWSKVTKSRVGRGAGVTTDLLVKFAAREVTR